MDDFNPLTSRLRSQEKRLAALLAAQNALAQQLAWHADFDPSTAAAAVAIDQATIEYHSSRIVTLAELVATTSTLKNSALAQTRIGWNPLAWVSSDRRKAKVALIQYSTDLAKLRALERRHVSHRDAAAQHLSDTQESLDHYNEFELRMAEAELATLEQEIARCSADALGLAERAARLDAALEAPREELASVRRRIKDAERDLVQAQAYERDLDRASNSYERAMAHKACERRFGDGSPSKVSSRINRELTSERRGVEKLERRLRELGRRASQDVRSLVIDGSNLCYEGGEFIGLWALRTLCTQLVDRFDVTVVFDSGIKAKLGVPDEGRLRSQLSGFNVHLAASRTGADETILDVAQEPTTYVISNDRFVDFPEKSAVREGRLIRHEILNGRILVADLSVDASFDRIAE